MQDLLQVLYLFNPHVCILNTFGKGILNRRHQRKFIGIM